MSLIRHLFLAPSAVVLSLVVVTTLAGCGDGNDDAGDSDTDDSDTGGSHSGGSNSGGSEAGGSETGGTSSSGGESGDGPIFGDPCTEQTECPMLGEYPGNCRTIWPEGYCTAGCNFADDCGPGNVCNMGLHTCLKACEIDDQCREGYRCYDDYGGCEPEL